MKTSLHLISAVVVLLSLAACSPDSATLVSEKPVVQPTPFPKPQFDPIAKQEFQWITEDGGQSQFDFNPQVDILFVIDNSDSMKTAQENLRKNIDSFAAGITKNKLIDYHIGVTSTWDSSERFAKNKKDTYQNGELRFVKDAKDQNFNQRFITRNEQKSLLASSLTIGVASYADGGPEVEEFFSPLNAALEKSGHGAANDGFFRTDAQLVVIIMTDADDSSAQISPEDMARTLVEFKGGQKNKVSVYGVLVPASRKYDEFKDWGLRVHPKYHPECFDTVKKGAPKDNGRCTGFGPDRLEQMILAANSEFGTPTQIRQNFIMSIISSSFGKDLTKIGADIGYKTLEKEILLSQRPKADKNGRLYLEVRYGTNEELAQGKAQLIPQKQRGGWLYDADANSIHLSGEIDYNFTEGAHFEVKMIPLTIKE